MKFKLYSVLHSDNYIKISLKFKFKRLFDTSTHTLQHQYNITYKLSCSDKPNTTSNEH